MALKQVLDIIELLDRPSIDPAALSARLTIEGVTRPLLTRARSRRGSTMFVSLLVPGTRGRSSGGGAPTLGVIGFLGGVGARPAVTGLVSDGDGAVAALAAAAKLCDMHRAGDRLTGDVVVTTHVSPDAPVIPHDPVPFMSAPVSLRTLRHRLVDPRMQAILSIDTTRGNRIVNHRGIAISPTVKQGYVLRVSEDLLSVQERVTGRLPVVFPVTTQDITPYGNGVFHLNSILQPSVETDGPVVGVAITSEVAVPGSASGATHEGDVALAVRFVIEAAKGFGDGKVRFFDAVEFRRLTRLYGSLAHLQTLGGRAGRTAPLAARRPPPTARPERPARRREP